MDQQQTIAPSLAGRLARVMASVGHVAKDGHNSHFNYDYVTESALVAEIREKLAAENVFIFTSIESQHNEDGITYVSCKHTFMDCDGNTFEVCSQGQGADKADKGVYKAITGAMKYFLMKNFLVATGDDPEREDAHAGRSAHQGRGNGTPRERTTGDELKERLEGENLADAGDWVNAEIHFGKNKGAKLGELDERSLQWYRDNWQPKPYQGRLSPQDVALRAALDASRHQPSHAGAVDDGMPF